MGMTLNQVMTELKKMGTAQNVKIYKRHGAGNNLYGVSFANLKLLQKQIRTDQALAEQLWETGNADARCLATMIAEPEKFSADLADKWANEISYYPHADLLSVLSAKTPRVSTIMRKWMSSDKEFVKQCGYDILGGLLANGGEITDADCILYLRTV